MAGKYKGIQAYVKKEHPTKEEFNKLSEFYEEDLNANNLTIEEFQMWQKKLKKLENETKEFHWALKMSKADMHLSRNK